MITHIEATADLPPASPAQPGAEEPRTNGATRLPTPFLYSGLTRGSVGHLLTAVAINAVRLGE